MRSYEVTLIEKKEKTLLVNAESEVDAMLRVQNGFVRGEIDMDDTPDRLIKFLVDDARAGLFAIKPGSNNELVDISEVTEDDEWDEFCDEFCDHCCGDDDNDRPYIDDEYGYLKRCSCFNPCISCDIKGTCTACKG